ncbi:MAG: cytochrome b/b6 domain-containing protein [Rhodobacter sp.]|nr:cytochrome b/b6 domain-containing protein [Rhodobacter sp.]
MTAQNSPAAYGSVAKTFHWLTALLILTAIPLGVVANQLPYDTGDALARKAWLFSLHKTAGIAAFLVALLRIAWAAVQPKPAPLHPDRRAETLLADIVHWMLYVSLVLVPLSGWIHHAATEGFAPILWPLGQSLPLVPKSEPVAALFGSIHWVFTKVLAAAILLHIAGALKHALIDRDGTLARMLPGRTEPPPASAIDTDHRPAILSAAAIYAAGFGLAFVLAAGTDHSANQPGDRAADQLAAMTETPEPPAPEASQGNWTVTEGTLGITVQQLGSAVAGSFADWSADIAFDETAANGRHGTVDVQIAIASLALGSVTSQALGPDFFAADAHPDAGFTADILAAETGYLADGSLTLRGTKVPVSLPFTLDIDGSTARMTGTTTLDRRDFGIGESYPDESSVGFSVAVEITLAATRAE